MHGNSFSLGQSLIYAEENIKG